MIAKRRRNRVKGTAPFIVTWSPLLAILVNADVAMFCLWRIALLPRSSQKWDSFISAVICNDAVESLCEQTAALFVWRRAEHVCCSMQARWRRFRQRSNLNKITSPAADIFNNNFSPVLRRHEPTTQKCDQGIVLKTRLRPAHVL